MDKLILKLDGIVIGGGYAGGTINSDAYDLSVTPAFDGWIFDVPPIAAPDDAGDDWRQVPPSGRYTIERGPTEPEAGHLTPEQIRAAMPVIYPTDFARLLKGLVTENYPNGVLPSDVEAIIDAIPDKVTRELARWDFNRSGTFERSNAWIDIIGAEFPMTPEEMDAAWMAFVEGATQS